MKFDLNKAVGIIFDKLDGWLQSLVAMLPNAIVAVLIIIVFFILAKFLRTLSRRLMNRFSDRETINKLFSTFIHLFVIITGLIIALNVLHLDQTVTSLLAGAGIIGLALGFAFQDISANFIAGIIMAFRKPIRVGDIISSQDYTGIVDKIDLRVTIIRTFQGLHVIIPNKDVFQSPVTNFTRTNERRIDLSVGVSYGDDLEKVKKVTLEAVQKLPDIMPDKEVKLYFSEFADSSINFTIMVWIQFSSQPAYLKMKSDVIMAIKKAFDDNDITIPFPIRTLDFGIKGGEKLSQTKLNLVTDDQRQELGNKAS